MSDITVLTSITAGKDHLRDDHCTGGAKFIAYVSADHQSGFGSSAQHTTASAPPDAIPVLRKYCHISSVIPNIQFGLMAT